MRNVRLRFWIAFAAAIAAAVLLSQNKTPIIASEQNESARTETFVPPAGETYRVVKVIDGDTLVISKDGADMTLRLIGIDAPESMDPRRRVQCFGREASDEARRLLEGKQVVLKMDVSQGERDKYGRTLAYVYVPASVRPEGILINEYMIENGFAHEYTYATPYKYQNEFKAAEVRARIKQRGMWAPAACGRMQ